MATYEKIASVTVGSGGAADIEFTSIPGTYTDLVVKLSSRVTDTAVNDSTAIAIQLNGDTGSNYTRRTLFGDGGATGSSSATTTSMRIGFTSNNGNTSSTFGNCEFYIPNYAGSTQKSVSADAVAESNVAQFIYATLNAGIWTSTSAITSIKIISPSFNFVQHSSATLYGIKNS